MTPLELPAPGEQPSTPLPAARSGGPKPLLIVGLLLALLVAIGVFSQLVRLDNDAAAGADPPADPEATMPVPDEPVPDGPAAEPSPWIAASGETAPDVWRIVEGRLVAVVPDGVYVSRSIPSEATFIDAPDGLTVDSCWTHDDTSLWVIASADTETSWLWMLDLSTQQWLRISQLRNPDQAGCLTMIGDAILLTSADPGGVTFQLFDLRGDNGWLRWIDYPTTLGARVDTVVPAGDRLTVDLCVFTSRDGTCEHHLLSATFDPLGAAAAEPNPWVLFKEGVQIVRPSERHLGVNDSFKVVEVDGGFWQIERRSVAEANDEANWAAGPVGHDVKPFPRGLQPQLFAYEGTVIAAVPRTPFRGPTDWWIYNPATATWDVFGAPAPTRALQDEVLTNAAPGDISGLLQGPDGNLSVVMSSDPTQQVIDRFGSSVKIAGDRLYVAPSWTTAMVMTRDGQPQGFQEFPFGESADASLRCSVATGNDFAAIAWPKAEPTLIIHGPDGQRHIPLVPNQEAPLSNTVVGACRPLLIDTTWHVARVDLTAQQLRVFSVHPNDEVIEHRIDITGEWFDAISPYNTYQGETSLYRDGDRIVAHICVIDEGAQCSFTDLSFDRSLIDGAATATSAAAEADRTLPRFYPPNDHAFGAAEQLHQLGDELWRADTAEEVGTCVCAEGGDDGPYYQWVGGRFDGPSEVPHTRTLSFRHIGDLVLACGSDAVPESAYERDEPDFVEPSPTVMCHSVSARSTSAAAPLDTYERPWSQVSDRLEVDFSRRDANGTIFVVPAAGQ